MVTVWQGFMPVTNAFTTVNIHWPIIILSTGQNYDILLGQRMCRNCTAKLFNQIEPEEKEVQFLKESMQVDDKSFESSTDFVNLSL